MHLDIRNLENDNDIKRFFKHLWKHLTVLDLNLSFNFISKIGITKLTESLDCLIGIEKLSLNL